MILRGEDLRSRPLRVVFFGSPDYACPALRALHADDSFRVTLAVTQPDKPAGRGRRLQAPAVKRAAEELGLPVFQPDGLRDAETRHRLIAEDADLFIVAAYGVIFGPKALAIPRFGCLNLHASILPKYRGASPIPAAILEGDEETGVSLMVMASGIDTGSVIAVERTPIGPEDTTESLTSRLGELGAGLAVAAIPAYVTGAAMAIPQPGIGASLVRQLVKADGWIDWARAAPEVDRHVRAMWPWPRAFTTISGDVTVQIHRTTVRGDGTVGRPGTIGGAEGSLIVSCGSGALSIELAQLPGRRPVGGGELLRAGRVRDGEVLGAGAAPEASTPIVRAVDALPG